MRSERLTTGLIILLVSSCAAALAQPADFCLTILHTNDLHAHDEPFLENGKSVGGMSRIGHAIRRLKKKYPSSLVIDAGDSFQGTPLYALKHGEVEMTLLDNIGYDIVTIGNHEFDDGPSNLAQQLSRIKADVISANLDCSSVPELQALVKPSVTKKIDGKTVGFVGAITADLVRSSITLGGVKLQPDAGDWLLPIKRQVEQLTEQGVDKIVLVSHCGVDADRAIAQSIPQIDVIVGGHSHTRISPPIVVSHPDGSRTMIVQTGCYGRSLGILRACFDGQGKLLEEKSDDQLLDINASQKGDNDLTTYISKEAALVPKDVSEKVCTSSKQFSQNFNDYRWDTPLGDLIGDAFLAYAEKYGATIALQNRGGIRSHIEPGVVTLNQIEQVLPFDNTLVIATVSGEVVLRALENGLSGFRGARFLEVRGLKFAYDLSRPVAQRVIFALAQEKDGSWQPIARERSYRIAVNSYNFNGGEGHDFSSAKDVEKSSVRGSVILRDYLRSLKKIQPQAPCRIVSCTHALLSLLPEERLSTALAPGHSRLLLYRGQGIGIEPGKEGVPVPLQHCRLVASGVSDESGNYVWTKEVGRLDEDAWYAVVALPQHGDPLTQSLISEPLHVRSGERAP